MMLGAERLSEFYMTCLLSWTKEVVDRKKANGGVYLIQFAGGIKVGRTKYFPDRLATYQHAWCQPIEQALAIAVNADNAALGRVERSLLALVGKKSAAARIGEFVPGVTLEQCLPDIEVFLSGKMQSLLSEH